MGDILITYAYAGVGHKKAAEAIKEALHIEGVRLVDILDYSSPVFKFLYPRVYLFLIDKLPGFWGFCYYALDLRCIDFFIGIIRRFSQRISTQRFIRFIKDVKPALIIATHFLPAEVVSELKRKGDINSILITVVTDFMPHTFWLIRNSEYFIVALENTKEELVRRGISEERIFTFGIPHSSIFSVSKDKYEIMSRFGIEERFNVLIMSGGFGTGPIAEIVRYLDKTDIDIKDRLQLLVICGNNKPLLKRLERLKNFLGIRLKVFGYMDNIDEFMEISNIIVTKSGGLTISEALSKNLPMIIVRPVPGQETRNCKILQEHGVAVRADNIESVARIIETWSRAPETIDMIRRRMKRLHYPASSKRIAEFIERIAASGYRL